MTTAVTFQLALLIAGLLWPARPAWNEAPPMPAPVTNNAVVAVLTGTGPAVFSFLGLDSTRRWNGVVDWAFRWDLGSDRWRTVAPVPGRGRLAATAQAVRGRIYLFGGYTVAEDGSEKSLPNVDVYDPATDRWSAGAPIPVPVDDAVSGVWRDSLVFLVSGWHDRDNVADVQMYDPAADRWRAATPIPGPPVFGHAGGIAGNEIIYLGGARPTGTQPRYRIEGSAWRGRIDPEDPTRVEWSPLPEHPGPPLYRSASVGHGAWVIFAGGTDNPYNYDGIGYDGVPSRPRPSVLGYHTTAGTWRELGRLPVATMDHRAIGVIGGILILAGGMEAEQTVTRRAVTIEADALLPDG